MWCPNPLRDPAASTDPFHLDRSWALSNVGLAPGTVWAIGLLLMVATISGFAVAGIALLADLRWWGGAAIAAAGTSTALLALYIDPLLVLGLAINTFVLSVAEFGWPALRYAST